MAVDGINKWTPSWKAGEISRVSTRFSSSVEDERADAGRDSRTRFARLNFQAQTQTENITFSVQLSTSRIGNHTRLIHTQLNVLIIDNTYQ